MPFRVKLLPSLSRRIASWGLSDFVLVEVYLRLRETLAADPLQHLQRVRQPFDGMVYAFSIIDPENRLREHSFVFHVVFSQDEETLVIAQGGYQRRDGL